MTDPRRPSNGTRHDLLEILLTAISAVLSDCDSSEDVAEWDRTKEGWLRQFLVLGNGVLSEKTFLRIFQALDPKQFEAAFRRWVSGAGGALRGVVPVDGKTLRGSGSGGESVIHMVRAFATELGVVLGQEKVNRKSNEITAIPELMQPLYTNGLRVSVDAMGCPRSLARQITDQGGDCVLAVKDSQPTLLEDIKTEFIDQCQSQAVDRRRQVLASHARLVAQAASVLPAPGVVNLTDWPKCKTIGLVDCLRMVGSEESDLERRYYISSGELTAEQLATAALHHWGIEKRLHWVLDVSSGEDGGIVRKDNAPQNCSLLKKIDPNPIRLDTTGETKCSLRMRRERAAWDDDIRAKIVGLTL